MPDAIHGFAIGCLLHGKMVYIHRQNANIADCLWPTYAEAQKQLVMRRSDGYVVGTDWRVVEIVMSIGSSIFEATTL